MLVSVCCLSFKENCPDLRNSKIADLISELKSYGIEIHVHDPVASPEEARHEYGLELVSWENLPRADAIIVAVSHRQFIDRPLTDFQPKVTDKGCFIDVKSQFDPVALREAGFNVWRL
jgi:UDP-N-acetyl-D-galactosamine dehydrogenase